MSRNYFEVSFHFKVIRGWILPWQNEVRVDSNEHVTASDCQEIKTDLILHFSICAELKKTYSQIFYSSTLATTQILELVLCLDKINITPTLLSYPYYFSQSWPPLELKNLTTSLNSDY